MGPSKVGVVMVRYLVLGRLMGRFPVDVASRTCLANLYLDIFITWPKKT